MAKITPEIKQYIKDNRELSNRKLRERIIKFFEISISHGAIGRYKKTLSKKKSILMDTLPQSIIQKQIEKTPISKLSISKTPKLSEEEVTEIFDFMEHCSRKRFGKKVDRNKILNIFLKLAK